VTSAGARGAVSADADSPAASEDARHGNLTSSAIFSTRHNSRADTEAGHDLVVGGPDVPPGVITRRRER
jgi:hypothetical protein